MGLNRHKRFTRLDWIEATNKVIRDTMPTDPVIKQVVCLAWLTTPAQAYAEAYAAGWSPAQFINAIRHAALSRLN